MSHLITPTPNDSNSPQLIAFSDADRRLRRRYILTQGAGWLITIAMLWMMASSVMRLDWLSLFATIVLTAGTIPFLAKAVEIYGNYRPARTRRKYTRQVFRFIHERASVKDFNWSPRASYTFEAELINQKARLYRVTLRHVNDAMLVAHLYEVSPRFVRTLSGPHFETIFSDLVLMSRRTDDFGESDTRVGDTFKENLRDRLKDKSDVNGHEPIVNS